MTYPHPCVFVPHPCGPVPFLDSGHPALRPSGQLRCSRRSCGAVLVQRKGTKRKDTPSGPVSGLLPADCAIGLRGSLTVHPWTATNARASYARPFGLILHPLAGPQGDPGGRAARSCAQKQKRSVAAEAAPTTRLWPCAQERAASCSWVPFSAGERRSIRPAGARAGRARVRRQRTDALSANPGRRSRTRRAGCPEGGAVGGPFLLVPFLWASKEKEPARRDAGRTNTDVGRFSRSSLSWQMRKKSTGKAPHLPYPASAEADGNNPRNQMR